MGEPVEWDARGTPRSPRFGDVYRTASGGLEQARHVFLHGCGLPAAWAGRAQWRILETGFGLGVNFLATWRAWKDDPQRPRLLHFVSLEAFPVAAADLLRSAIAYPALRPLAEELAAHWWGLTPGFHRLSFEEGRVLLTLCIGDVKDMLREQAFLADSVFLDGFDPRRNAQMWELPTLKAVARLCRRGASVATWTAAGDVRRDLAQCGFQVDRAPGLPPKRHCLRGRFDPAWEPKGRPPETVREPGQAVVIGAGLAGAAVAASLARRGWRVQVLEAASGPAAGASGLPAGLLAPQSSPDDNPLSRLSRAGVRMTLQQAAALLPDDAWQLTGSLEHRMDDARLPPAGEAMQPWTRLADAQQKAQAGLPAEAHAWWHDKAGWIRPASLVRAWLQHPAIARRWQSRATALVPEATGWRALGQGNEELARGDIIVVAAAYGSGPMLARPLVLNPVRGQVSWSTGAPLPLAFPINGNGHLLPDVALDGGRGWLTGSTYGRGDTMRDERPADHQANLARLRELLPPAAEALAPQFAAGAVQAWTGVRCTSADRRPLVGEIAPGLCISAAHGSRGLTFTALCAELIAAQLHGEPLPVEKKLADALDVRRHRSC